MNENICAEMCRVHVALLRCCERKVNAGRAESNGSSCSLQATVRSNGYGGASASRGVPAHCRDSRVNRPCMPGGCSIVRRFDSPRVTYPSRTSDR